MFKPSTQKDIDGKVRKAARRIFLEKIPLFDMIRADSARLQLDVEAKKAGTPVASKYHWLIDQIQSELDGGFLKASELGKSMHRFYLSKVGDALNARW